MRRLLNRAARLHRKDGFSLLEVMFALVFLGIGLLGVAGMIPLATHQIVAAKAVSDGVAVGQTQMEALRTADFGSPSLAAGTYAAVSGKYGLSWTILDNVPVSGSKRINMTVSWTTTSGTETTQMSTLVTR
jgi:prepilin-type N-terminal cleavage/methylation domain-containing protein